ncbi:MAG: type II secretion system F family protein [Anaerolineae bacterium]|nr:type II secretion system F family protein [Anaerolineae bacterium]
MDPFVYALAVVGLLALVSLILALRSPRDTEVEIARRLDAYAGMDGREVDEQEIEEEARRLSRLTEGLNRAIERRSFGARIQTQLAQASLRLTVAEYLIWNVISVVLMGGLAFLIFRNFLMVFGLLFGIFLPRIVLRVLKARRLRAFNDQLGDTINLLVNSIRAGFSMPQAMETVAANMPPPVSEEFRRVTLEIGLGVTLEEALQHMLRRVDSADLDLLITAINVSSEVGGNLATILETISHTIRERVRIQGEIKTLTAQGLITGYVLSGLPFVLTGVLYLLNREYMGRMFTTTCGWIMSGVSVVIILLGFVIIQRIVKIEV